MRIGIAGYGNLGRALERLAKDTPDIELKGIFTRRNKDTKEYPHEKCTRLRHFYRVILPVLQRSGCPNTLLFTPGHRKKKENFLIILNMQ